jgi:hypothetical protein
MAGLFLPLTVFKLPAVPCLKPELPKTPAGAGSDGHAACVSHSVMNWPRRNLRRKSLRTASCDELILITMQWPYSAPCLFDLCVSLPHEFPIKAKHESGSTANHPFPCNLIKDTYFGLETEMPGHLLNNTIKDTASRLPAMSMPTSSRRGCRSTAKY